jgi:ADP-heptose:LPS heptosyltransferase/GT2 family glycosyltransferase
LSSASTDSDNARITIERPVISDGAAGEIVLRSLIIEGWAVARGGVDAVEIEIDGIAAGRALYGVRRPDVAHALPDWDDSENSGFLLVIPGAAIGPGGHRVRVRLLARTGPGAEEEFTIRVEDSPVTEGPWILRRKMPLSEIEIGKRVLAGLDWRPNFGLVLGIGEVDEEVAAARRTLAALREQAYPAWRVTIVPRGRTVPDGLATRLVEGFEEIRDRIAVRLNVPLDLRLAELAGPCEFAGVLLAGDLLGCDALLEIAIAAGQNPDSELIYCDENRISPVSGRPEAFFKPDWSPDLMLATNYVGRFWCALPAVLHRAAATYGEWLRFGDYDLALRCTEATPGIRHIPKLLCERGREHLDNPQQEQAALKRAMARGGVAGEVAEGPAPGYYRIRRAPRSLGLVSIIIPTCAAGGLVETCLRTLRDVTGYKHFEIICIENIPPDRLAWRDRLKEYANTVVTIREPFNWSRFNNLAARHAKGEFLLFLNDDTEIVEPGWLDALLRHAERPEIGVVGARLLYPDRTVQHAGMFWTPPGGRHAFRMAAETDPGYFGLALTERNVTAVTGACMMMRREAFEALGGFEEAHTIVNNDVDYCLRASERGLRVVYAPGATLIHHELASRRDLDDLYDTAGFARRWGRRLQMGDPFYSPHLSKAHDDYQYDLEPIELVYPSHPLFDRNEVRDILAVKLDHIGDFVIAIPALRRLQEAFPQARLHLLAAPGSTALAGLVPGLASVIEFEFFHARSGLGERVLSIDEVAELRRRLEPYRFDLAVDFRKHPETRVILRLAGARWLAGFDGRGEFPWLDIVTPWEQDPAAVRKQSHIGDDLLRLAEAVAAAPRPIESLPRASGPASTASARPLVCVHPGVGSTIRQWPAGYYAALIDMLVAAHDVEIVLIGGAGEATIADEVIAAVRRPAAVRSVAGKIALADLPALLSRAALYVGNNSGPKHLAAGLGVPTIGIHSGTVDAREWGPVGENAVAIRRSMTCSPCYLAHPEACWRHLACMTELRPADIYGICARMLALARGG